MAEWEIEAGRCNQCGAMVADCSHAEKDYYPRIQVCYATMARLAWQRAWGGTNAADGKAKYHDGTFRNWSTTYSESFPYSRDDGVVITVSDRDDGSWDALVGSAEASSELDQRDDSDHEPGEQHRGS